MKRLLVLLVLILIVITAPSLAFAQGMMGVVSDDHTAQEEAEGKEIWEKFQNKEEECEDLSDENFGALGEYFMGQMMGDSHEAMNKMMMQMMGEAGEEQMHIVMGKKLSGCDTSAQLSQNGIGFMPMMTGMMGGNINRSLMMGNWGQNPFVWFGLGSWLVTLTMVVWLIVGVLAGIWLWKQVRKK